MNVAILHLSDLHIRSDYDPILNQIPAIKSALLSTQCAIDACLVLVTGDIAFSGTAGQYAHAARFFCELNVSIRAIDSRMTVHFAFVPGNHDCCFSDDDLRVIVLDGVVKDIDSLAPNGGATTNLLQVQTNFFAFMKQLSTLTGEESPEPTLYWEQRIPLGNKLVKVCCYNTAFMSRMNEIQGQLFFPQSAIPKQEDFCPDLAISLFHHPYNWLESNNGKRFEAHIQSTADVVLTGHQHLESSSVVSQLSGATSHYLTGGVLQEADASHSSFNVVVCDLLERKQRVFQFDWNKDSYHSYHGNDWKPLTRNPRARREFINSPQFSDQLADVGLGINHPKKKNLTIRDIFVYPEVDVLRSGGSSPAEKAHITSENLARAVSERERVLIVGGDYAGKSALARTLYCDLITQGFVPVLLTGNDVAAMKPDTVAKGVNSAFEEQYSAAQLNSYKGLDRSRKVLIVDDWHRAGARPARLSALIRHFEALFGKVILFADDLYRISEFKTLDSDNPLSDFEHWEIRQFGYVLRNRLIRKWHLLGTDSEEDSNELLHEIDDDEKLLDSVLCKNLLPSYPGTLILLLHTRFSIKPVGSMNGSYGYLFEALISSALARVAGGDPTQIDTKYTVLSRLAYHVFKKDKYTFTKNEVEQVVREYFEAYEVRISVEGLIRELEQAQIVVPVDGNYQFRYKYYFYFFIARYYQENLRTSSPDPSLLKELQEMVDFVYCDDYSTILMFVVYLTRSPELFEHILKSSYTLFAKHAPCDFQKNVAFLNEIRATPILLLPESGAAENREDHDRKRDEDREHDLNDVHNEKISYSDELDDLIKLNIALKNLHLMGQVVRNFAGSIRKEQKIEFLRAAYKLGLRILAAGLRMIENEDKELRKFLAEIIYHERKISDPVRLGNKVDEAISRIATRMGVGILRNVSYSVGARILEPSYQTLLEEENHSTSFQMIDVSVKLDHFRRFPEDEIRTIWKKFQKNIYGASVVRELVWHHFYLFNVQPQTRKDMIKLLGFPANLPGSLTNTSRMSRPALKAKDPEE